jgi:hypothetical protein
MRSSRRSCRSLISRMACSAASCSRWRFSSILRISRKSVHGISNARRSVAGEFAVQLVELALMQHVGADRPQARQAALP